MRRESRRLLNPSDKLNFKCTKLNVEDGSFHANFASTTTLRVKRNESRIFARDDIFASFLNCFQFSLEERAGNSAWWPIRKIETENVQTSDKQTYQYTRTNSAHANMYIRTKWNVLYERINAYIHTHVGTSIEKTDNGCGKIEMKKAHYILLLCMKCTTDVFIGACTSCPVLIDWLCPENSSHILWTTCWKVQRNRNPSEISRLGNFNHISVFYNIIKHNKGENSSPQLLSR